jgi:hypothetical protein
VNDEVGAATGPICAAAASSSRGDGGVSRVGPRLCAGVDGDLHVAVALAGGGMSAVTSTWRVRFLASSWNVFVSVAGSTVWITVPLPDLAIRASASRPDPWRCKATTSTFAPEA